MRRGIAWIAGAAVAAVIVVAATRAPRETAPPSPAAPPATEPTDADELRKGTEPGTLVRKGVAMDEAIERFFGAIELSDAESAALVDTGTAILRAPERTPAAAKHAGVRSLQERIAAVDCVSAGERCRRYQIDLTRCFLDAADVVAARRRERGRVPNRLFQGAILVSVISRELPMQSAQGVLHACDRLSQLRARHQAPKSSA